MDIPVHPEDHDSALPGQKEEARDDGILQPRVAPLDNLPRGTSSTGCPKLRMGMGILRPCNHFLSSRSTFLELGSEGVQAAEDVLVLPREQEFDRLGTCWISILLRVLAGDVLCLRLLCLHRAWVIPLRHRGVISCTRRDPFDAHLRICDEQARDKEDSPRLT